MAGDPSGRRDGAYETGLSWEMACTQAEVPRARGLARSSGGGPGSAEQESKDGSKTAVL
ncbi:hypothetical protein [Streptomyces boncukensis]|uniref:Uncharacterized protein n=1 Tax=Streptomyces boncukensis TaxID=2711219 RepID=A0A6G4WU71_9ACTN|nr:hypothetical protein [Streptomyces boncukensis]NGO68829.1 hypothetical protein [Streptomyces boncukensis]